MACATCKRARLSTAKADTATPPPPPPPRAASLVAIDLARKVLKLKPDTYVLVVSHENITNNWCGAVCVWRGGLRAAATAATARAAPRDPWPAKAAAG